MKKNTYFLICFLQFLATQSVLIKYYNPIARQERQCSANPRLRSLSFLRPVPMFSKWSLSTIHTTERQRSWQINMVKFRQLKHLAKVRQKIVVKVNKKANVNCRSVTRHLVSFMKVGRPPPQPPHPSFPPYYKGTLLTALPLNFGTGRKSRGMKSSNMDVILCWIFYTRGSLTSFYLLCLLTSFFWSFWPYLKAFFFGKWKLLKCPHVT